MFPLQMNTEKKSNPFKYDNFGIWRWIILQITDIETLRCISIVIPCVNEWLRKDKNKFFIIDRLIVSLPDDNWILTQGVVKCKNGCSSISVKFGVEYSDDPKGDWWLYTSCKCNNSFGISGCLWAMYYHNANFTAHPIWLKYYVSRKIIDRNIYQEKFIPYLLREKHRRSKRFAIYQNSNTEKIMKIINI